MYEAVTNGKVIGPTFQKEAKSVLDALANLNKKKLYAVEKDLNDKGKFEINVSNVAYDITEDMVAIKKYEKTVYVEKFVPSVIQLFFYVDRIMYAILEHNFSTCNDDEQRSYLSLPPIVSPIKCSVLAAYKKKLN